ncbi:nitrate/nitrite transporter NrtS [Calothrix sp. FACHB-1219]|uniref:nitrate/nitrite transporter NrtS n=1 Tax=unclassified Calothrix TaxID=2619626 RepID=UPI00168357AC|nr:MULTISPECIES: nitrate/nitrite transporter NrtS [unclassified Calothrix]MBD2202785.1 nitrate/nitrite transporter NrtS [Calothrix sp. FACHB-168]MBD2218938.1 nitrate/nitrite transporter NrtS [Calothrix sp. FACHB-1219]
MRNETQHFRRFVGFHFVQPNLHLSLTEPYWFTLNHGAATIKGQISRERWISAALTYIVPYMVNIHGQYVSRARKS